MSLSLAFGDRFTIKRGRTSFPMSLAGFRALRQGVEAAEVMLVVRRGHRVLWEVPRPVGGMVGGHAGSPWAHAFGPRWHGLATQPLRVFAVPVLIAIAT